MELVPGGAPTLGLAELLRLLESFERDEDVVHGRLGPDPLFLVIPALLGHVPERDVGDIDEDLVLALLVPDLVAGVARVGEDRPDGALGPGDLAAVAVAVGVCGRGRGHAAAGELLGDVEQAAPFEVLLVDPRDHQRVGRVRLQLVQPLPVGGLGGMGMRAGVDELIAVRRSASQIAALGGGDGVHRGSHPQLDAVAFALGQAAEDAHDHVVGLVGRVDRAADLGHPQLHAVVLEDREGQAVLVAVEGALRLADDHGLIAAIGIGQFGQQGGGVRAPLPGDRAGLVDVEELRDDLPAAGFDERARPAQLPGVRGVGVLLVLGGDPAEEREASAHRASPSFPQSVMCCGQTGGDGAATPANSRR
nr:hypothetical protein [Actinomadura parmotrematis]